MAQLSRSKLKKLCKKISGKGGFKNTKECMTQMRHHAKPASGERGIKGWTKLLDLPAEYNPGSDSSKHFQVEVYASPGGMNQPRVAFMLPVNPPLVLGTMNAANLRKRPSQMGPTLHHDWYDGRLYFKGPTNYERDTGPTTYGYNTMMRVSSGWRIPKDSPALILAALENLNVQRAGPGVDRSLHFPVRVRTGTHSLERTLPGGGYEHVPLDAVVTYDRVDKERGVILRFDFDEHLTPHDGLLSSVKVVAEDPGQASFGLYRRTGKFKGFFNHFDLSKADAQRILIAWDVLVREG